MAKKLLLILLLLIAVGAGAFFIFRKDLDPFFNSSNEFIANDPAIGSIKRDVTVAKDRIFTADEPLRKKEESVVDKSVLTVAGVVKQTNIERESVNLPALKPSLLLNKSAELKIDDMFTNQYFEHISPSGQGPSDLAKKVNYDFVIIGENLALGNFDDDKDLVAGWMASPGHRENILRNGYEEIGVAVREGMFEGHMTWLAVQEFGAPSVSCPKPDTMLAKLLDDNKLELTKQELVMNQKKLELDAYNPKTNAAYAQLVQEYNSLIQRYNALVAETKLKVGEYNSQAEVYNDCLVRYSK
ncbi:MAG: CAP domain-containing protein [Candidatus Falkowbacteria bacterium]|nr:CAP domain-containing protein [Candidatus Falkowbacteria bacterium]